MAVCSFLMDLDCFCSLDICRQWFYTLPFLKKFIRFGSFCEKGYHGDGDSSSPFDGDGFVKVACIF